MVFSEGEGRGNGEFAERFGEKTGLYYASCLRRYGFLHRIFADRRLEKICNPFRTLEK